MVDDWQTKGGFGKGKGKDKGKGISGYGYDLGGLLANAIGSVVFGGKANGYGGGGKGAYHGTKGKGKGKGKNGSPSPKGKGKSKGKSEAPNFGQVGNELYPFSDTRTPWYKCVGCEFGWCFKGHKTPTECKHCHSAWDFDTKYDWEYNLMPGQVIKPIEKQQANNDQPVNTPSSMADILTGIVDHLSVNGCTIDKATKYCEQQGLMPPPPKAPPDQPLNLQLHKAETAVKHKQGELLAQQHKRDKIISDLKTVEDKCDVLAQAVLNAQADLTKLQQMQCDNLAQAGFPANQVEANTYIGKLDQTKSKLTTYLDNPPASFNNFSAYKSGILDIFDQMTGEIHNLIGVQAEEGESSDFEILEVEEEEVDEEVLGEDEEATPSLNGAAPTAEAKQYWRDHPPPSNTPPPKKHRNGIAAARLQKQPRHNRSRSPAPGIPAHSGSAPSTDADDADN